MRSVRHSMTARRGAAQSCLVDARASQTLHSLHRTVITSKTDCISLCLGSSAMKADSVQRALGSKMG